MKESRLYINFFKKNLLLFCCLMVGGLILAYYFASTRPIFYSLNRLYLMDYQQANIDGQIALTDQAVSEIRSANVQQEIGVSGEIKATVFKPGPLSISLTVESPIGYLISEMKKFDLYLTDRYPLKRSTADIYKTSQFNYFLYILGGATVGFGLGLLIALLREYLRKY